MFKAILFVLLVLSLLNTGRLYLELFDQRGLRESIAGSHGFTNVLLDNFCISAEQLEEAAQVRGFEVIHFDKSTPQKSASGTGPHEGIAVGILPRIPFDKSDGLIKYLPDEAGCYRRGGPWVELLLHLMEPSK